MQFGTSDHAPVLPLPFRLDHLCVTGHWACVHSNRTLAWLFQPSSPTLTSLDIGNFNTRLATTLSLVVSPTLSNIRDLTLRGGYGEEGFASRPEFIPLFTSIISLPTSLSTASWTASPPPPTRPSASSHSRSPTGTSNMAPICWIQSSVNSPSSAYRPCGGLRSMTPGSSTSTPSSRPGARSTTSSSRVAVVHFF